MASWKKIVWRLYAWRACESCQQGTSRKSLSKATQLLEQIQEEGIEQSLGEVENLKAATNKADADLDENSQVKDVLTRIASALQQEEKNAEQDPQTLVLFKKLYDILMSLHSYLKQ